VSPPQFQACRVPRRGFDGLHRCLALEAHVGGGWLNVPIGNVEIPCSAMPGNLAPLLRCVILIRELRFRLRFDFQRVRLSNSTASSIDMLACGVPGLSAGVQIVT
jgi:hypothetical protein